MNCSLIDAQPWHATGAATPWLWLALAACVAVLLPVLALVAVVATLLLTLRPWDGSPNRAYSHFATTPWPAFMMVASLRFFFQRLSELLLPAPARVMEIALAFATSQVLFTIVKLDIPNKLRQLGPQTASQLAVACGAAPRAHDWLARLLATACTLGLLERVSSSSFNSKTHASTSQDGSSNEPVYRLNALSAVLCDGEKEGVRNSVKTFSWFWPAYHQLSEAILSGKPAFEVHSKGTPFWDVLAADPAFGKEFDATMAESSNITGSAAVFDYPWRQFDTVIDVGGGQGGLTAQLLRAYPKLRGIVVDQQEQVQRGRKWWEESQPELLPRVELLAGNFFDSTTLPPPPPGNTAYVLRYVLHDWPDAECISILKVLRQSFAQKGLAQGSSVTLVLLEVGLFDKPLAAFAGPRHIADMHMLVAFGDAKERDEAGFRALMEQSGWRLTRVVPTRGLMFAIEGKPDGV